MYDQVGMGNLKIALTGQIGPVSEAKLLFRTTKLYIQKNPTERYKIHRGG